jgi:PAS domain S-box-containing protein
VYTDAREIFVTLGAAFTGPAGGVVIGILAGLASPSPEFRLFSIGNHIIGALWIGWAYRRLVYERLRMPALLLGWVGIVFVYYFVCTLPLLLTARLLFPEFFSRAIVESDSFVGALLAVFQGWTVEFLFTSLATVTTLAVLPGAYRAPLWGNDRAGEPPEPFSPPGWHRRFLAVRLTVWFLLLSFVPIGVLGIFVREALAEAFLRTIGSTETERARTLAWDVARDGPGDLDSADPGAEGNYSAFLLDAGGAVLWSSEAGGTPDSGWVTIPPPIVRTILGKTQGYVTDDQGDRLYAFARVPGQRTTVVIMSQLDRMTSALNAFERESLRRLAASLALVSLVGGLVIWLMVGRPMRTLAAAAHAIGAGDLHTRIDVRAMPNEVGELGRAFNEMAADLEELNRGLREEIAERARTEEALRRSEERFRDLSDLLPQPVYECDAGGHLTFANKAAFAAFGIPEGPVNRELTIFAMVAPADRARAAEAVGRLLAHLSTSSGDEYEMQRANGETFPALVHSSIVEDGGTIRGLRGIVVDISALKRAENALQGSVREKELLLKEIHHRVKNNLQIISSLLNLQAGFIRDPHDGTLFQESVDRVRSMALIHEKLYSSEDFSRIDFHSYMQSLVDSLLRSYGRPGIATEADIGDIRLSIQTAVPCGLLLNELIVNALKHAFPGDRRGSIRIAMHRTAGEDVELLVADDGAGLPEDIDPTRTPSLGLHLVYILSRQLNGTLSIHREGGTTFRLVFPEA